MRGVTSAGAEAFILNYSDMATVMPLEEAPENAIDKLLRELVPAGSESVREHIRKSKKAYKKAFAKVSDDTRASLVEVIDGLGEAGTDGASEWAQELRDLLGIKRVEAKEILDEKGGGAAE